jgi:hypothetical protein
MSCRASFECKTHKSFDPKLGEIVKTGPRPLREGIFYPPCSLLQLGADGVYEPLSAADPALIKAALSCELDTREYDEPCSAGVILQGCLIADWTFANTPCMPTVPQIVVVDEVECVVNKPLPVPAQFTFTEEKIEAIINCSNCCITFEWLANCQYPLHEEPDPGIKKEAVAPKAIESLPA